MKKIILGFIDMWKADYQFKTLTTSTLSALVGLGFTVFNVVLGIVYKSVWNISISVYYVLLAIVRGIVVHSQRKVSAADNQKNQEQYKRVYFKTHILMIIMDMCLIAPIAYMVIGERSYEYGIIPAIAILALPIMAIAAVLSIFYSLALNLSAMVIVFPSECFSGRREIFRLGLRFDCRWIFTQKCAKIGGR